MGLHELYCKKLMEFREVEMIWAGDRKNMPQNLITLFSQYEEKEKRINDPKKIRLTIIIYCNYSFEDDITRAVRLMIGKSKKEEVDPDEIGFEEIKAACYASTIPDIDILIRSSGELRLSNFDMLRMSYTEFFFIDKLWPDFTTIDLLKILESFRKRIRRYGGVVNKV
jgi:undecaprenyl diphosphate synthase